MRIQFRSTISIMMLALVATVSLGQQVWPPPYAAIELKAPGDTEATPYGINSAGALVGSLISPNYAFVWLNGAGQYLYSVNRIYSPDANDINDAGWIVGVGGDFSGNFVPTLWIDGEPMSLGTFGGARGEATAINQLNHIAGYAEDVDQYHRAFLWRDGELIALGTLGGRGSWAYGINSVDQVVGHTFTNGGPIGKRGFLWDNGTMIDIGTWPGGSECQAFDINDLGQIVGRCNDSNGRGNAFIWEDGVMRTIHDFRLGQSSWANRINNHGQIVGFVLNNSEAHAFIWDEANRMRLLEDLMPPRMDLNVFIGRDINDYGQIALDAIRGPVRGGRNVAVLLTPVHPTMTLSDPTPGIAGQSNTLTLTDAAPGATVRFYYSLHGGGELIPGCASRTNALQLESPTVIATAIADANGEATITRNVPLLARGQTILFQAVVQDECAISQLVAWRFR